MAPRDDGSFAAAIGAGRYTWRRTSAAHDGGVLAMTLSGALVIGGIGFVGGFFGPMIFAPEANQNSKRGQTYFLPDYETKKGRTYFPKKIGPSRPSPFCFFSAFLLLHQGNGLVLGETEQIAIAVGRDDALSARHERRFVANFDAEVDGRLDELCEINGTLTPKARGSRAQSPVS